MNLLCIAEVLLLLTTIMLVEQDVELDQLRQVIDQLQEEKKKTAGWGEKLAKELKVSTSWLELLLE